MSMEAQNRELLARLAAAPPQVLLLEGGDGQSRLACALYWAQAACCPAAIAAAQAGGSAVPCGSCVVCRQIAANEYMDLHIYDGRISNKQDEDNPGPIRALSMDNMQALRSLHITAPHGRGRRIAIFQGMGITREEALNSLLKMLEEPSPHTLFALLAPQRQQLLPTLVSRSFCVTLPWKGSGEENHATSEWEKELGIFLAHGTGFLDKTAVKGALDATLAGDIVMSCQRALCRILGGRPKPGAAMDKALMPLAHNINSAFLMERWCGEALDMLAGTVAPARVLEGFCTRLFTLLRQKP